ncbi:hypothetical protein LIER_39106 [Lithospermum erythrorhizon]|uniref:Protein FAR1-RELATED SEQUENCE n=1 Tax=Lithospermum erythrorhizon TaxID=34254 RepID=A0AAV3QE33_LITER
MLQEYFVDLNYATSCLVRKVYYVFKLDPKDSNIKLDVCVMQIDLDTIEWACSCRMFENWGALYRHILKAVDILGSCGCYPDLRCIQDKHVLKRWTRTARSDFQSWIVPENEGSRPSTYTLRYQGYCSTMMLSAI